MTVYVNFLRNNLLNIVIRFSIYFSVKSLSKHLLCENVSYVQGIICIRVQRICICIYELCTLILTVSLK